MKAAIFTSILLIFSSFSCFGQYQITMDLGGRLGPKFAGYKLDSSGLFAAAYEWDYSIFGGKCCRYKSIKIEYTDLDALTLYRVKLLLDQNDFFRKDQYFYWETTAKPIIYSIQSIEDTISVNIYDYHYCGSGAIEKNCYLISELRYLLSLLIPSSYDEFKFYPAMYAEKIKE
ncbi:MAG: hypothetical protein ACI9K1_000878 [Arcticibacterium sp.]|jgi:hypothetical protein